jgi:phage tail sheath protein FI
VIGTAEVTAPGNRAAETGLYALGKGDPFNLLCVPPYAHGVDLDVTKDWAPAAQYCRERRALLIVDAPSAWTIESAEPNVQAFHAIARENAALYFPRVLAPNPLDDGKPASYAPCGMVAGVMARTDASRGVWKAPAGVEAGLSGVGGLIANGEPAILTDSADGRLNGVGINCLRRFPSVGFVVWGARTLAGADVEASQWKYVNVRRLSLYIEESIDRGTQWVVFEPNSEPTWSAVVRSVQTFLAGLWREGAFAGNTQSDSFFVTCDRTTMTQDDIQNGRLVAIVGMAPIKPAEFVIIQIGQRTAEAMR